MRANKLSHTRAGADRRAHGNEDRGGDRNKGDHGHGNGGGDRLADRPTHAHSGA